MNLILVYDQTEESLWMKTVQINEKLLTAAKEYIAYIETSSEADITEVEQLEDEEHEPSLFVVLC